MLHVDVLERGRELVVEVELAGVLETEIDVTLAGSILVLHAERPSRGERALLSEIPRGLLERRVALPEPADLVAASFEEGLLTLVLRRREVGP